MAIHHLVPNPPGQCNPRPDRQNEEPAVRGSERLFPLEACLFVCNLSTEVPHGKLLEDVKTKFSMFGKCYVWIKPNKNNLPRAFVQYATIQQAQIARKWNNCIMLHDRWLRIKRNTRKRTVCFGLRSGLPITLTEVLSFLVKQGHLEYYTLEPIMTNYGWITIICKATFAYVVDYRDALKQFETHPTFYLTRLPTPPTDDRRPHCPYLREKATHETTHNEGPSPKTNCAIEESIQGETKRPFLDFSKRVYPADKTRLKPHEIQHRPTPHNGNRDDDYVFVNSNNTGTDDRRKD